MGFLFSKKKPKKDDPQAQVSDKDRAILELKRQRDRLKKYRVKIESVIKREQEIARKLLRAGRKKQALLALKKKKYQETLIEKTDGQLMNLEEMVNSIEFASLQSTVFDSLKKGNEVLQKINSETSIEDVEQLMEDSAEAIEYQSRISEMLAGELTDLDNEEIEREYAELAELEDEKEALQEDVQLPDAPTTEIKSAEEVVEESAEENTERKAVVNVS